MTPSRLTLSDLERPRSRSLRFRSFVSCIGAELGQMLLLNIIKKAYRESVSVSVIIFEFSDLERSMSRPLKF